MNPVPTEKKASIVLSKFTLELQMFPKSSENSQARGS